MSQYVYTIFSRSFIKSLKVCIYELRTSFNAFTIMHDLVLQKHWGHEQCNVMFHCRREKKKKTYFHFLSKLHKKQTLLKSVFLLVLGLGTVLYHV